MVLVVVPVKTVSAARLQVYELLQVGLNGPHGILEVRVVHRVRLWNAHLDAVNHLGRIDEADASELVLGELDRFFIGHFPDVVAGEAEVLDAEAGGPRPDHVVAPGAVVLNAARACLGVVQVDPVVRKRLGLSRHQRDQHEIAVAEVVRRCLHVRGWRRIEAEDEVFQRQGRDERVDLVFDDVSVLPGHDSVDPIVRMLHGDAPLIEVDVDSGLPGAGCKRLPHLAWPESRIPELFDQRSYVFALQSQHRQNRLAEGEVLDSLRCPERPDLRSWDPPDLLRVRPEKGLVQTPPEARRHPLLEGVRVLVPMTRCPEVRERAAGGLDEAEPSNDVPCLDRVREVLSVVEDAGAAGSSQELVS